MIYEAFNTPVFDEIPRSARRVLDLGCGSGALGRQLKRTTGCEVVGVTYSQTEADLAAPFLDRVVVGDLNDFQPTGLGRFDCIVCSHVLEHLYAPDDLLRRLLPSLDEQSTVIVALPNILHWRQRLVFLSGRFRYTDGGLMDRTHFRFFDWMTARALLEDNGYHLVSARAQGTFPLSRFLALPGKWLDALSVHLFPALFGTQFILTGRRAATK